MKILKAASLAVSTLLMVACGQGSKSLNSDAGQLVGIVGGTPVSVTEAAAGHVVGLVFVMKAAPGSDQQGVAMCTGTLVTKDIVLTAAHCADIDYDRAFVVFGPSLLQPNPANVRKVIAKSVNPAWQPTNINHLDVGDTGLIKFSGALPAGYSPAELLQDSSALSAGTTILEMGYGISAPGQAQDGSGILRKGSVTILDSTTAKTEVILDETHGQGVCEGDSGGPAFVQVNGKYLLWGVASRVAGNAPNPATPNAPPVVLCNRFAIETNIVTYANWLQSEIQKLDGSSALMASLEN